MCSQTNDIADLPSGIRENNSGFTNVEVSNTQKQEHELFACVFGEYDLPVISIPKREMDLDSASSCPSDSTLKIEEEPLSTLKEDTFTSSCSGSTDFGLHSSYKNRKDKLQLFAF